MAFVLIVLVFLIIKPFLTAILTGVVLSYIFYPIYQRVHAYIKRENVSAFLVSFLVVLVITLPLLLAVNTISREARVNYLLAKQRLISGEIFSVNCADGNATLCRLSNSFKIFTQNPQIKFQIEDTTKRITNYVVESISKFLLSVPIIAINFFIMVFITFFLFRDGEKFVDKIKRLLPLKTHHQQHMLQRINDVTYSVIYGHISVAVVQGFLAGLGFFIFGLSSPILWGVVTAFFALIPVVGTAIVWLPIGLYMLLEGYVQLSTPLMVKGALFLLYGLVVISSIDNLIKPKIIGQRAHIHPVFVLLGVLGGVRMFGFIGIVVGPLIIALFLTFIKIYEEERGIK